MNYPGIDDNADLGKAIEEYKKKGYIRVYDSWDALCAGLRGERPALSKLSRVKRKKFSASAGKYVDKERTILDLLESCVTAATSTSHRSILPRATDAIRMALELGADLCDEGLEILLALVCDFVGAFWLAPSWRGERRFTVAMYRG